MKNTFFLILLAVLVGNSINYAESATSCDSVQDNFSSLSYSNNDGSQNWANSWQETGESDGASAGKVRIRNDLCSSGYCLRLGTPSGVSPSSYSNRGAIRQVNLTNSTSATLTFNYFTGVNSGSSTVTLSVSNNGGSSWTSLKTYTISSTNFSANPESFDITAYISSNTQIRFMGSGTSSSVTGMYIDDIKIDYCQTTSATPILEYKFDACALSSAVEDSQGNYDGIASGADSSDSTSVLGGRSLDLTGTSTSDWVTVPKSAISGLTDFSFSVWIKTGTSTSQQEIFHALGSSTGDDELEIYLNYSNTVILKIRDNNETLSANKTLTDNAWHHLLITRENDDVCLYVDGNQTDCDSGASTGTLSVSYSHSVVIGQEQDSTRGSASTNSGFNSSQSFKGYLDELKIYNTALSSSQVQTLYSNESSGNNTSSCVASLLASYNFDDDWVTNNSLTDQTGSYNGSPSGSVSQVAAGASGYKGNTCKAASFSGGDIDITGLPVSTSTGATTSVSFWMYWDGTNNVMPMGWYQHDLWLVSGYFGFNTWNNDLTGIYSSGLSSGWHHVAAVFTNGNVNNNKLYIDGTLQTLFNVGNPYTPYAVVNSALRIGGVSVTSSYRFSGKLDNFKIYDGTITQAQVSTDMAESNACPSTDTPAVAFNCVENGSHGISGKLYTKTTAQSFSVDVIALQNSSTIESNFASGTDHTVTVELVDSSSGGSCSAYSALNPTVSQSLLFTSSDAGNKASASMTSSTAYPSVKCRVTDATDSPSVVGCSTDNFSIRPTNFTLTSSMSNSGSTGSPVAKAGANFTLSASATTGYTGTPKINSTKVQAHSGAISTGTLSGAFNAANAGVATSNSFNYSEVGSFQFATEGVYDDTFTAVDPSTECSNDFSNTVVSGKVGCKFGNTTSSSYFGRFTPDHFDITLNTPIFNAACGTFTYLGQAVKYTTNPVATFSAKNSSAATTQNYSGNFWKITASTVNPSYSISGHSLSVLESSSAAAVDNSNGTGTLTFTDTSTNILGVTKSTTTAPFDAEISMTFSLTDSDGITVANVNGSAQANPVAFGATSAGNGIDFNGGKSQRWGRLALTNIHGSELSPLSMPINTEYYNGTSFVKNSADNCTTLSLANDFSISDSKNFSCSFSTQSSPVAVGSGSVKASLSSTTLSSGSSNLVISDNSDTTKGPGLGNTGAIDITTRLSSLSWLLYDWDTTTIADDCPSARATFGIYKGNSKQIYFREVY